jgi:hypothetical protein
MSPVRGLGRRSGEGNYKERLNTTCSVPECGKDFAFDGAETQMFELPLRLFERRHFYRSELREP